MDLKRRGVAVLGAGIGGLAAALALAQRGARVAVYEQAEILGEAGAGIQISENGIAVLRALGIGPGGAVRSEGVALCSYRRGRAVLDMPPPAAGPTWYFHRADLIALLADAVKAAGIRINLGRRAGAVTAGPDQAALTFTDGGTASFGLVIGADGIRGVARAAVDGAAAPQFSGQLAWRAVVPWEGSGAARAMLSMGPGRHVVTYPLRGARLMNLVAVEERRDRIEEGWRQSGDPEELRARFAGFGGRAGEVLARVETVHRWALYLHPVAAHWSRGALALLGDAAHPTLPFMAQGACLALEDAWVLARSLESSGAIGEGLARYQALRKPRAERVVAVAAANARRFHARSPLRQFGQAGLRLAGRRLAPRYEWIYGFDVTR